MACYVFDFNILIINFHYVFYFINEPWKSAVPVPHPVYAYMYDMHIIQLARDWLFKKNIF